MAAPKVRVLVVDFDAEFGPLVCRRLRRDGFASKWAATGHAGLFQVRFFKPNLILLGVHIPNLDGIALHKALRSAPKTSGIPLLLITAISGMDSLFEAATAGLNAEPIFRKADGLNILMERVRHLLHPKRTRGAAPIPFTPRDEARIAAKPVSAAMPRHYHWDGLRFYPDLRRIAVAGTCVRLNTKEAILLELLIRRPGVVYSSERMWAAAWPDSTAEGWRHTLDSRISSLRKKLGKKQGLRLVCQKNEGFVFLPRSCKV